MNDLISRQAAIDAIEKVAELYPWKVPGNRDSYSQYNEAWQDALDRAEGSIGNLPSAQLEPLTDKEQRIFLAAMGREEKACKQVDEECRDCREAYEDSLVGVCHEIIRKVKAALWET